MFLATIYEFLVKKNDPLEQFIPQPILSFFPKWETADIYFNYENTFFLFK